jgi:hypothetical protein
MKLACTGFVSATAGSVAAANALLLGKLLDAGSESIFSPNHRSRIRG